MVGTAVAQRIKHDKYIGMCNDKYPAGVKQMLVRTRSSTHLALADATGWIRSSNAVSSCALARPQRGRRPVKRVCQTLLVPSVRGAARCALRASAARGAL